MFPAANESLLFSGSEDKDVQKHNNEDKPLYHNASLTIAETVLLVGTFPLDTPFGCAMNDLLILISLHCIRADLCRTSLHQF